MKNERQILKSIRNWSETETWRALDVHHKGAYKLSTIDRGAINDIATIQGLDSIQAAYQWGYAAAMGIVQGRIANEVKHMEDKRRMSEIDRLFNDPKANEIIFSKVSKHVEDTVVGQGSKSVLIRYDNANDVFKAASEVAANDIAETL